MGGRKIIANFVIDEGKDCDSVIEAEGIPATFELCQNNAAPGGSITNVGAHGTKLIHIWKSYGRRIYVRP